MGRLVPRLICFDSCPFISMVKPSEANHDEARSAMSACFAEIEAGRMVAVASTIIFAELLDKSYDAMRSRFDNRRGHLVEVNEEIAMRARVIRDTIRPHAGGKCLDLPDCIYIATAGAYDCEALVTVDGLSHDPTVPNLKHRLLTAAPMIEKRFGVKVRTPMEIVGQGLLPLE